MIRSISASLPGHSTQSRTRGTALLAVVPIAILMMSLMVAFVGTTVETSRAHVSGMDSFRARAAAQSVASIVIADLWGDFEAISAGDEQIWTFRAHLDTIGLPDQAGNDPVAWSDYLPTVALATNVDGDRAIDGVEIERVAVHRIDRWDATDIVVEVDAVLRAGEDGSSLERRSSIRETFTVQPPEWDGLDFALLASNVNCLLCHTTIDNVDRVYNQDMSRYGSFEQVMIGSIDAIHFRSDPDSQVAGVMLIGGDAIEGDGHDIKDWSAFNLRSVVRTDINIVEDVFGDFVDDRLNIFDPVSPDMNANLFLNFFKYDDQVPYDLPDRFPPPFTDNGGYDLAANMPRPDLAGNRIVDDTEFEVATLGMTGSISGGSISVFKKGKVINSAAEVAKMVAGNAASVSGVTDGNTYLHGTETDPLLLDGDVAFDGDVIISGVVKGMGTVRARGNVYITSDLIYSDTYGANDPNRTYGMSADGTENNLAIAAGGNIVIGDYARPAWGGTDTTDGTKATNYNFTMEELGIFNRLEWMKTRATLPGKAKKVQVGEKIVEYPEKVKQKVPVIEPVYEMQPTGKLIKKTAYKKVKYNNGLPPPYYEEWTKKEFSHYYYVEETKKVQVGTKVVNKTKKVKTGRMLTRVEPVYGWKTPEHPNPYYQPLHKPRYYNFKEGQVIPIFRKDGYFDPVSKHWISDELVEGWDDTKLAYADPKNAKDPYLYDAATGKATAVVQSISPTRGWIDPELLRSLILDSQVEDVDSSKTLEIDATLYSGNSIIGVIPARDSKGTDGTLLVNGGLVAADVGVLAPTGTQVNYDIRGARALSITSDIGLVISRRFSAPVVNY
ncbi:MAG: hypothetical protein AAGA20_11235 [Planctomycetota bacterium]